VASFSEDERFLQGEECARTDENLTFESFRVDLNGDNFVRGHRETMIPQKIVEASHGRLKAVDEKGIEHLTGKIFFKEIGQIRSQPEASMT